jgi:hypothetical protein
VAARGTVASFDSRTSLPVMVLLRTSLPRMALFLMARLSIEPVATA